MVALAEIMFVRVGGGWRIVIFATNATGVEVKVVLYFSCSCDNFCSVSNNSLSCYEGHHESQVIFHNKSSTIECSHPWNVFSIEYFAIAARPSFCFFSLQAKFKANKYHFIVENLDESSYCCCCCCCLQKWKMGFYSERRFKINVN